LPESSLYFLKIKNLLKIKDVYLWSLEKGQVSKTRIGEGLSSCKWQTGGNKLGMGDLNGRVSVWDMETQQQVQDFYHSDAHQRVGVMEWRNQNLLTTGSKDNTITSRYFIIFVLKKRDLRTDMKKYVNLMKAHSQEVCGLKWSDHDQLASGGNDNKVCKYIYNKTLLVFIAITFYT